MNDGSPPAVTASTHSAVGYSTVMASAGRIQVVRRQGRFHLACEFHQLLSLSLSHTQHTHTHSRGGGRGAYSSSMLQITQRAPQLCGPGWLATLGGSRSDGAFLMAAAMHAAASAGGQGGRLPTHARYLQAKQNVANRGVRVFGTARQKMAPERWTSLKLSRRTRSPRFGVPSCRGEIGGRRVTAA
jgi:hypothetical protein